MNERIKELAEQAGARTKDVCYGHGEYYDEFQLINDDIEKFAKLIVQECMNMSDELKSNYLKNRKNETDFDVREIYAEGEAACDTLKHRMKKRFGVDINR